MLLPEYTMISLYIIIAFLIFDENFPSLVMTGVWNLSGTSLDNIFRFSLSHSDTIFCDPFCEGFALIFISLSVPPLLSTLQPNYIQESTSWVEVSQREIELLFAWFTHHFHCGFLDLNVVTYQQVCLIYLVFDFVCEKRTVSSLESWSSSCSVSIH